MFFKKIEENNNDNDNDSEKLIINDIANDVVNNTANNVIDDVVNDIVNDIVNDDNDRNKDNDNDNDEWERYYYCNQTNNLYRHLSLPSIDNSNIPIDLQNKKPFAEFKTISKVLRSLLLPLS
jgi:hypothetical protein